MITYASGDLFDTDAEAIVNSVNCVGAMGKGIALGVRDRWPVIYRAYRGDCGMGLSCDGGRDARIGPTRDHVAPACCAPGSGCRIHRVAPGRLIARRTGTPGIAWVIDMPTKRHWYGSSLFGDVVAGIEALPAVLAAHGIRSIALPPPGCGNGGLDWAGRVRPVVERVLGGIDADVRVHAPGP